MSDVVRHIIVRGKVQGVGYRAWLADEAKVRGLAGWVRNCEDHTVEAVLSGPEYDVLAMIDECKRGPNMARVSAVDQEAANADMMTLRKSGEQFSILPKV